MKQAQELRIDGFGLPGLHPRPIHHPISAAEFICLNGPLWLVGMVRTEFEFGELMRMDKYRRQYLFAHYPSSDSITISSEGKLQPLQ